MKTDALRQAHERAGEPELVAEMASCLGVTSRGRMQLRGTGSLVLGEAGLAFVMWLPNRTLMIPRASIRRVEHVSWHLGKSVGRKLLKVFFVSEEHLYDSVAFVLAELGPFTEALTAIGEANAARVGLTATEPSPLAQPVRGRALVMPSWMKPSLPLALAWFMSFGALAAIPGMGAVAGGIGIGVGAVAAIAGWLGRRAWKKKILGGEPYEAGPEGLRMGDEMLVPRWQIVDGVVIPSAEGASVTLRRRGLRRSITLKVAALEEARAMLHALGVGAADQALTRKIASRIFSPRGYLAALSPFLLGVPTALLLGVLGLGEAAGAVGVGGLLSMMAAFYTLGFVKTRVTVGADGVRIAWLGRERLIALSDVERVEAREGFMGSRALSLHLRSGERVDLTIAMRGGNLFEPFDADAERALLIARIEEARQLGSEMKEATLEAWMERRGALPVTDWVRELRLHVRLRMKESGGELLKTLLGVAEAANAPPALRAAAAVALGPALDDTARARLRAAAQASAVPKVRVALEAAADDRDGDLVEVLTELSDAHRAQVRVALDEELMAEAEQEVEALLTPERSGYRERAR